ncbi:MAG: hypothetical protein JKX98_06545 [Alcanivoracaceae bacterium]|nr:hypothetical protein [Alcanivoracaceae bacterium]
MLFFGALVLIIAILMVYNYFNTRLRMRTVQNILKDNKELTPEQIHAIFQRGFNTDLRNGFFSIALAFANIIFGLILGGAGYKITQISFIGMAMFPGLIGLTYLYFHFKSK